MPNDVVLKFDAQTAAFVQSILAAKSAAEAAANSTREFADKAVKGGDDAAAGFDRAADAIKDVVTGIVGSMGAVEAFNKSLELMKEKADALKSSTETVRDVLFKRGEQSAFPAIDQQLESMVGGQFDRPTIDRMFSSVAASVGNRVTTPQLMDAMQTAIMAGEGGANESTATQTATAFANLAPQLPGMSADDVRELSNLFASMPAGSLTERGSRLIGASGNKLKTIDELVAAAKVHEGPRQLDSMLDDADKAGVGIDAWLANPAAAPQQFQGLLQEMAAVKAPYAENAIATRPFAGGLATMKQLAGGGDPSLTGTAMKEQADVDLDQAKRDGEQQAITDDAALTSMEADMIREHGDLEGSALFRFYEGYATLFGARGVMSDNGRSYVDEQKAKLRLQGQGVKDPTAEQVYRLMDAPSDADLKWAREQLQLQESQHSANPSIYAAPDERTIPEGTSSGLFTSQTPNEIEAWKEALAERSRPTSRPSTQPTSQPSAWDSKAPVVSLDPASHAALAQLTAALQKNSTATSQNTQATTRPSSADATALRNNSTGQQ